MFERNERQIVPGYDLYGTAARVHEALFRDGQILLQQISPTSWMGKGPVVGLGFVMKTTIIAVPMPNGGFALDVKIEAELEDMGIVWLGVGWFVCLPVAAVLFFFAWRDATTRQKNLFAATWSSVFGGSLPHGQAGYPPLGPR
ncbi:MAG: hypothetical protein HOW73_09835 [Polyangiaceae bacterium]|nr:hypothetical protein [Polyangiaceae bacterium]